jgi:predicted transcriptional regulator YheO
LFSDVDEAAVSTYITNVPWYSSRIEPQLAAVETGESTDDDESTAEESTAEESTAAESTAEESTAEESTAAESTEAAEESTSIVEVSADSGAFMIKDSSSGSILYIAVPALLAMGAPLLL